MPPQSSQPGPTILRIESLALPASDVDGVVRFYRWALQLKGAPEPLSPGASLLSWGREDRIRLVDGKAAAAVGLRMPAMTLEAVAAWCDARELVLESILAGVDDAGAVRTVWPSTRIDEIDDEAQANRLVVTVRGPFDQRVELAFPTPRNLLISRGRVGPFYRKSGDWSGLEIPGLLGVTTGVPDPEVFREFARMIGLTRMDPTDDASPFLVGDHQWVIERRETPGISAFAVVVSAARVQDLKRTLEHLGADYRHEGNRLLAVDPEGRVVLVTGVRGA